MLLYHSRMKDGAHLSPLVALSFPDPKKVPIYCWVDRQSFPVVGWQSPGSNSRLANFLHHNRNTVTTQLNSVTG